MRIELLNALQEKLETLELPVYTREPNWERPQEFPLMWLELGNETLKEGVNVSQRKIPISVYIANRGIYDVVDTLSLLEIADNVENTLSDYIFDLSGKKAMVKYTGSSYFQDQFKAENGVVVVVVYKLDFEVSLRR